ncbi:MAG: ComEC/Rec2 family competence protein [Candidatus Zixiibacteriota bacterium]
MFRKYPSLFLLVFVAAGILLADRQRPSAELLLALTILFAASGLITLSRNRAVPAGLLLGLSLGAGAGFHLSVEVYDPGPDHLSRVIHIGEKYVIYGKVADWPDLKPEYTEIKIRLDSLVCDEVQEVSGAVLLKISDTTTALQRGDRVAFRGRILPVREEASSASFDYHRYLNLKGMFGVVYLMTANEVRLIRRGEHGLLALTDRLREGVKSTFYRNLSPRSAALASGFLIGETRDIPPDIYRMFRDSGTLHLLAVSGSNVALVVLFVVWILRPFRLSRNKRYVILIGVIVIFTILSYGEPSVVRASLMAVLVIGAIFFQRRYDLNNIIALAAFIILMADPAQLFDVGFQLSFVTAWGLIFVTPALADLFKPYLTRKWYRWLVFPIMISLVAQVSSTPIITCYFGRVPIIGVIANLVIVPLVSAGVLGVMILLAADLILPFLGQTVGVLLNVLLDLIVTLLYGLGGENIPVITTGRLFTGDGAVIMILGLYGFLWMAVMALKKKIFRKVTLLYFLIFANVLLGWCVLAEEDRLWPRLTVTAVPGGAAAVLQKTDRAGGTLLVTDLHARTYPLDEKILNPFLAEAGLGYLEQMVVLTLDYQAIDDLLRTALVYRTRYVYINQFLNASFADVIAERFGDRELPFELVEFGTADDEKGCLGIYPDRDLIRLVTEDRRIILVNDPGSIPVACPRDSRNNWLIIGRKWRPTKSDLMEMYRRGFTRLICSKIEPFELEKDTTFRQVADSLPADYLYDIHSRGPVRLPL